MRKQSRGHIRFDEALLETNDARGIHFEDLVQQTLESSEFIETRWEELPGTAPGKVLVVEEVIHDDEL